MALFDLENTLARTGPESRSNGDISPSLWTVIPQLLGPLAVRDEKITKENWAQGKYASARDWSEASVEIHKNYGLTKSVFRSLVESTEILPGYDLLVRKLKSRGVITGIISGGFVEHAEYVQSKLNIDLAVACCKHVWSEDGFVESWILTESDYEHKAIQAQQWLRSHDISPEDCVFVGDGSNDVPLAQYVGRSYAVNAHKRLIDVADRSYFGNDVASQIAQDLDL